MNLQKVELLKNLVGKKVSITYPNNGIVTITSPQIFKDHYWIIIEIGEMLLAKRYKENSDFDSMTYFDINFIVTITENNYGNKS